MSEMQRPSSVVLPAPIGTADGLFFTYHFGADGLRCDDPQDASWSWRSYLITDLRARQALAGDQSLPPEAKQAFLSSDVECHIDLDDGWLHGDLPDLHHDYSVEARGLGHFRFAFSDKALIGARKQPLDSVEFVRKQVEARSRPFKSPALLIEAVMMRSLTAMSVELTELGNSLDGIEDRIVSDSWHHERQALVDARRKLVLIHRQMATLSGLFRHLDHAHSDDLPTDFADMTARLSHRVFALHHDGEQLQSRARLLQDELMAKLGAQSNKLLYVLSVMTAVLLPMTIVTGLFGMNVGGMPFMQSSAGFWVVSIIAIAAAAITLYAVRRLGDGL